MLKLKLHLFVSMPTVTRRLISLRQCLFSCIHTTLEVSAFTMIVRITDSMTLLHYISNHGDSKHYQPPLHRHSGRVDNE